MRFWIISVLPEMAKNLHKEGVVGRAAKNGLIQIEVINLRDFAGNKRGNVDDKIYGGAPGMLLRAEPLRDAIESIGQKIRKINKLKSLNIWLKNERKAAKIKIITFSPAGKIFTQEMARKLKQNYQDLILICGRYEGIDARIEKLADDKISIGNYVLSGGELAAAVMVDTVTRLIPGVLGNQESLDYESQDGGIEEPQYTRPEIVKINQKILTVPKILLSGNHAEIEQWKKIQRINN